MRDAGPDTPTPSSTTDRAFLDGLRATGESWLAARAPAIDAEAAELSARLGVTPLADMLAAAAALARQGHGEIITYSRKVFIPLTQLCRDVCGYCTFAKRPDRLAAPYMTLDQILAVARAGEAAGCKEALFTIGDKPEWRYPVARRALADMGYPTTAAYLEAACEAVLRETTLLPHVNAGVLSRDDMARLRRVSISQGTMLETTAARLRGRGMAHEGAPDKDPALRVGTLAAAGEGAIPFTSGILIGIGETRPERIRDLLILRELHADFGHIQEVIVQNFRAKPGTRMAGAAEPDADDLLWTTAAARLILGPSANIQVPPNLSDTSYPRLLDAGINDWGGISPVTPDHVNPEAPWPQIAELSARVARAGLALAERLALYPAFVHDAPRWLDPALHPRVLAATDASGLARTDDWAPGVTTPLPFVVRDGGGPRTDAILQRAEQGERLAPADIEALFAARGAGVAEIAAAADALRARVSGDTVRYVVVRNINYTNVCSYKCSFCAFSKGRAHENLRGAPYDLALDEVARRAAEAWERGATEVCMQGGIAPHYTGDTYLTLLRTAKQAAPGIHVHAFSPLEVSHGAGTLGLSLHAYLERLRDAGLGSLPGTAAEILDDTVRDRLAPGKLGTQGWLDVIRAAHEVGLRTTSTIMFGHIETPRSWAEHLLHLRDLQADTGGITEFVPLPFVHMEAPMYLRGQSRKGPTWRESVLMHAVARLVLHPVITNIQASWVKLGPDGVREVLASGVNDLGGTLMDESISRAAGTLHGQEFAPDRMETLIAACGRKPQQRTTLYAEVPPERRAASLAARQLAPRVQTPYARRPRPEQAAAAGA